MHEQQSYICIPITESEPGRFLTACGEASEAADMIELRADYLDLDTAGIFKFLEELALKSTALLLLTFRPSEQGGMRQMSLGDRRQFWDHLPQAVIDRLAYVDFEFDLVESYGGAGRPPVPWRRSFVPGTILRRRRVTCRAGLRECLRRRPLW
ncbi:MAG: type I 3-dehydroquinate dehydratase [Acidobacteria bacterium]|nr:type I 3-dehydroquinate dehydratase [Acidobacteriota bacterium]